MKKLRFLLTVLLIFCMDQTVFANMAAPASPDVGSTVTFEKQEEIAVLSEVLDIRVIGSRAEITAAYHMKNTTDQTVTTDSMFLSPNIGPEGAAVSVNGMPVEYDAQRFSLSYEDEIEKQGWQYAVLKKSDKDNPGTESGDSVDAITFALTFEAGEEQEVVVSYDYRLGGYPEYDFDAKRGDLHYYLTPAGMWKDFEDLTVNLYLDEDMPVLKSSSLDFEKVDKRTYQYRSDRLPEEDLRITIDENWLQNIFSTLRSPYLKMTIVMFAPFWAPVLLLILFIIWRIVKKRKNSLR